MAYKKAHNLTDNLFKWLYKNTEEKDGSNMKEKWSKITF